MFQFPALRKFLASQFVDVYAHFARGPPVVLTQSVKCRSLGSDRNAPKGSCVLSSSFCRVRGSKWCTAMVVWIVVVVL